MASGARREFLGAERPFLEAAVERFLELVRGERLDPGRCVIVVPGRRAERRVQELIAERAPAAWEPPRVVTEGALPQVLSKERLEFANEWQRALAWRRAIETAAPEERAALWGGEPESIPLGALAQSCASTCDQLAAESSSAAEVARLAERSSKLGAQRRWSALAGVEARCRTALEAIGRVDPARAASEVARLECARGDVQVFGFALADLTRSQRSLLESLGARFTSFVHAGADVSDGFDELGALVPKFWSERAIAIDSRQWRVVDHPSEQARAAVEHLASLGGRVAPEHVSIGVPDDDVLPYLERSLLEAGCEPRWAGGTPLARTRVAQLVHAVLAFVGERRFADFAALLRHPDFEAAVAQRCSEPAGAIAAMLDEYANEHVPAFVGAAWLASDSNRSRDRAARLERVHTACIGVLGELERGGQRTSSLWASALAALATCVWPEVELDAREPDAWLHARALEALAEILEQAREADGTLLGARDALELIAQRIEATQLPPPPSRSNRPVVELFGWLELALDDAPHLVLTGVNEGALPQPARRDPWLFEAARSELDLSSEERRVARDTWALTSILASRPSTLLITGRRNSTRDPRAPSRFLFRCADEVVLERVQRMWPADRHEIAPRSSRPPAYVPPIGDEPAPTSMSVTSFRDYLASPYLFYLAHVARLRTLADDVLELDGRAFGSLAHDVLQAFGASDARDSTDVDRIREVLFGTLKRFELQRFGEHTRPAVRVQIEQLRARLERFARWQAAHASAGWRIERVEFDVRGAELDGMQLTARIDRIDFNARDGRWLILDYKTGESGRAPSNAHTRNSQWIDLQLPLYRYICADLCGESPSVGFVLLDKSDGGELCVIYDHLATKPELYPSAIAKAREVVAAVRAREFGDVGDLQPEEPILAALCGFGLIEPDADEVES